MPSGAAQRGPSRIAVLAGFGFSVLALGIAAAVMLLASPPHSHGYSHNHGVGGVEPMKKSGSGSSSNAAPHGAAAATHHRIAEVRDPEESKSFPAPASVHHSTAKTPQAAGVVQVAAGAASDAEIRSELARVKQLESVASNPAKMQTVPGGDSIVGNDGAIPIPRDVPEVVQRVIAGANAIANFPYVYGGGHASFVDNAYDCSGSVSYALAAGGLLSAPETSGQLESWGAPGPGKWITVYANAGHTYMYVNVGGAWMLYDTAGRSGVFASRWQPNPVDNEGYVVRHWPNL
jgi:cell wall-associated NlpC family hydrolase